jgi:hypothetical protein
VALVATKWYQAPRLNWMTTLSLKIRVNPSHKAVLSIKVGTDYLKLKLQSWVETENPTATRSAIVLKCSKAANVEFRLSGPIIGKMLDSAQPNLMIY